jgi:hypothetical protein
MTEFDHGIKELKKSMDNLKAIESDIKNDPAMIKTDWDKVVENIKSAYSDFQGIPVDAQLKRATIAAYEAFKLAEAHPDQKMRIEALQMTLHNLLNELEEKHHE